MRKNVAVTRVLTVLLVTGLLGAAAWAAKARVDASRYQGVDKEDAFEYLIGLAKEQAGKGSWENIGIANVYMLAGRKSEGEAVLGDWKGSKEASDHIRMGRAYYLAGDWAEAEQHFEEVLRLAPKDADWLAEIGCFYNVEGNREKAEELFERSFEMAPKDLQNLRDAAASYLGVVPRR